MRRNDIVMISLAGLSVAMSCAPSGTNVETPGQPSGWDDDIRIPAATDINPDPDIVELNMEARVAPLQLVPGGMTDLWTYDGTVPGPLIRARVGDRVIVHFTNNLAEETTIHWHGLRVPAAMDGMPGHSQPPIQPGGSFDYDFVVPDAAHVLVPPARATRPCRWETASTARSSSTIRPSPTGLGDEVVMVLSDIDLDDDGALQPADGGGDLGTLFGREGNVLLVNGKVRPTLKARPGLRAALALRQRRQDAATSRSRSTATRFTRIGGDGGLLTAPVEVSQPGRRARRAHGSARRARRRAGRGAGRQVDRLRSRLRQHVQPPARGSVRRAPGRIAASRRRPLPVDPARRSRRCRPHGRDADRARADVSERRRSQLGINGVPFKDAEPLDGRRRRDAGLDDHEHDRVRAPVPPARLLLPGAGRRRGPLEWKDTVNVPVDGTVSFVVRYDDRPGMWMFHCHILDHAEAGMMGSLMVMEPAQ